MEQQPAKSSVFLPSGEARHRLDAVDALRGLAIFFVLMNHVNMRLFLDKFAYWQSMPERLRSALVWNGQNGVQIFFVISGFLITSTSLRRWGARSSIRVGDFYRLRFARIAPLLLVLLGALSLLHFAGTPGFVAEDDLLARLGLDMTVLAVGTCLVIAATAQAARKGTLVLGPLRWLGRRSYEVYLTHMFVVMGFFYLFVMSGRPRTAVTPLFLAVVVFSGILGEATARYFSEPLNRMLRHRWHQNSTRAR